MSSTAVVRPCHHCQRDIGNDASIIDGGAEFHYFDCWVNVRAKRLVAEESPPSELTRLRSRLAAAEAVCEAIDGRHPLAVGDRVGVLLAAWRAAKDEGGAMSVTPACGHGCEYIIGATCVMCLRAALTAEREAHEKTRRELEQERKRKSVTRCVECGSEFFNETGAELMDAHAATVEALAVARAALECIRDGVAASPSEIARAALGGK